MEQEVAHIIIDNDSLDIKLALLDHQDTVAQGLRELDIRNVMVQVDPNSDWQYAASLPRDSQIKLDLMTNLADRFERAAKVSEDPDTRVSAVARFVDLAQVGYVAKGPGIDNPEQNLNLPHRLLELIDNEKNPIAKWQMLDLLVVQYYETQSFPDSRARFTENDWASRIDGFLQDNNHPIESIRLIRALVCRKSAYRDDGDGLEKIRSRYGLEDVLMIVNAVTDPKLKQEASQEGVQTYHAVMQRYKNDLYRSKIADKWTQDALNIVFRS